MSMRKKLVVVMLIVLVLLCLTKSNVMAASFKTSFSPTTAVVQQGSTVEVSINISDIDAGNGIYSFTGVLEYDTEVFETLTDSSIVVASGWSKDFDPQANKLTMGRNGFTSENLTLATITLKAKQTTNATNATLKLTQIKASGPEGDIDGTDITCSVQVQSGGVIIQPDPGANEIVDPTVNEPQENLTNEVQNIVANEDNSSNSDVPYTGAEDYIVPFMAVVVILGIISFINYKKIDDEN